MARKRYRPEEIVAKLRQVEVLQGQGMAIADAVRQIGVTQQTYYRWRKQYGGMSRTQDPSLSQSRPFFRCLGGTFSPSRRQIRSTRLWFTCQPDWFSIPVTIR